MSSTALYINTTSDLCTELLDAIRELRSTCSRSTSYLTKSKRSDHISRAKTLHQITTSLRAREAPLLLLRNEVESWLPLEDLGELAKATEYAIYELEVVFQSYGRRQLDSELRNEIADDLNRLRERAVELTAACAELDDELCPKTSSWSDK